MKNFTLIEMIVSIVIMAILASIVLVAFLDFRKTSTRNVMTQNVKIIQMSVDEYYLKNDYFPIKENKKLSLTTPQLIDMKLLKKEGYLKKELNTSKIKTQYYWVDVFGKVWGATSKDINSINLFQQNNSKNLEFVVGDNVEGYNIYEVIGYNNLADKNSLVHSNEYAIKDIKNEKSYKLVEEASIKGKGKRVLNFNLPNKDAEYLISIVDQFGLETAPFGKFSSSKDIGFEPLFNKTGVYEFNIASEEIMYWINFLYLIETPGDSSVTFQFKVKDENGISSEWQNDFYSLEPSKDIVVQIDLKGDDKGNKPTVYDIQVLFKYKDETINELVESKPEIPMNKGTVCPASPINSDISRLTTKKETGEMVYPFYVEEGQFFNKGMAPKVNIATGVSLSINSVSYLISLDNNTYVDYLSDMKNLSSGKCMLVVYDLTVEEVPNSSVIDQLCKDNLNCHPDYCKVANDCPISTNCEKTNSCGTQGCTGNNCSEKSCVELGNCPSISNVCGSGGSTSTYYISTTGKIVYKYKLKDNEKVSSLNILNDFQNFKILNVYLEYSVGGNPYVTAKSITDIPEGSCINVVYEVERTKDSISNGSGENAGNNNSSGNNNGNAGGSNNTGNVGSGNNNGSGSNTGTGNNAGECSGCIAENSPPTIITCKEDCPQICKEGCIEVTENCLVNCKPTAEQDFCNNFDCNEEDTCNETDLNCVPKCEGNCSSNPPTGPSSKDTVLNDPEWTTVERLRFFGHGPQGELIRWIRAEHDQDKIIEGKTRIVYRYSKSNGVSWTEEYDDFRTTGIASSVMGIAYIQVKTSELKNFSEENYPIVKSMRFLNEKGYLDMSVVQPTLTIIPVKDNNANRATFSNESNIQWKYEAADPRNKKIVDVEWSGDIRSKYPVGTYEIKARVKNDLELWSEWATYKLKVLQEKPVAVIKHESTIVGKKTFFQWDLSQSYDPDGDKIVSFELVNAKEEYEIGEHVIKARVLDKEGYWSDWTEYTINIGEEGVKVYRLEAEIENDQVKIVDYDGWVFENGVALASWGTSSYVEFKFIGTGFDIKTDLGARFTIDGSEMIYIDGGVQSFKGFENKEHVLRIYNKDYYADISILDYVDVYSSDDVVVYKEIKTNSVIGETISANPTNVFAPNLGQKITHFYQVDKDARETISILSSDETKIVELSNKDIKGGTHKDKNVSWNGKSSNGTSLPNGEYYFLFEYVGMDGTKNSFRKKIILKNETPIYRLEAEVENDQVKIVDYDGWVFENGVALASWGTSSYVEFKFKGTGFDIKTDLGARYTLNNNTMVYIQEGLYSIRNLENKEHVLRIYNKDYYADISILDYVDVYSSVDDVVVYKDLNSYAKIGNVLSENPTTTFTTRLNQTIIQNYQVDKDSKEVISIVSADGSKIVELSNKNVKGGTFKDKSISWNGKNSQGTIVSDGEYYFLFEYTGVDGSKSSFKKKVSLDNVKPSYRLEAEVENSQVSIIDHYGWVFDNGVGLAPWGTSSYVEFKFTGTGFDIKTDLGARYTLDNNTMVYIQEGLYTMRGLENKEHVLRIYCKSIDLYFSMLDYVDIYTH